MDQQYPQQYFRRWHLATPSQRILKVLADTEPLARLKCFCFWHAPYAYQIRLKTQMLILALMGRNPGRNRNPQNGIPSLVARRRDFGSARARRIAINR